jgi:hypothetical protein
MYAQIISSAYGSIPLADAASAAVGQALAQTPPPCALPPVRLRNEAAPV